MPHLVKQPLNIVEEGIKFPLENLHTFLEQSLGQFREYGLRGSKHGRLHSKKGVISRVRGLSGDSHYYAVLESAFKYLYHEIRTTTYLKLFDAVFIPEIVQVAKNLYVQLV